MTRTIWILALTLAFVAGTITTSSIVAQSDTITACVNDKSQGKDLRIVDSTDQCRNNETPLEWNVQGPVGPQGETGPQGPAGPAGTTEWSGLNGIPEGFSDNIDNVDDADNNPTNEIQSIDVIKVVTPIVEVPPKSFFRISAQCPDGYTITGGGFEKAYQLELTRSISNNDLNEWIVDVYNPVDIPRTMNSHAICAKITP